MFPKLTRTPSPYRDARYTPPRSVSDENIERDEGLPCSTPSDNRAKVFDEPVCRLISAGESINSEFRPTVLCRQHSSNREQQGIHKLVVHDHETAIQEVDTEQHWPHRAKWPIKKAAMREKG